MVVNVRHLSSDEQKNKCSESENKYSKRKDGIWNEMILGGSWCDTYKEMIEILKGG